MTSINHEYTTRTFIDRFDSLCPRELFFSVMSGRVVLGCTTKQGLMCLAKGFNTATPVMLELATA